MQTHDLAHDTSPAEAQDTVSDLRSQLDEARKTITQLERRQKIDALLADSDAVDLEVARLLTEAAVEMMAEPDLQLAIDDLRRQKPYLFRQRRDGAGSTLAPHTPQTDEPAEHAMEQAARTGDRRDLLRYLRLRRKA